MSQVEDLVRPLNLRSSVRSVSIVSILALAYSAYRVYAVVAEMIGRLAHRTSGVALTWNPGFPAPQPTNASYSGAPFVAQGSTPYFTAMTGTVKNVPISTIILQSLGDLAFVLTAAGIAVCILVLARRVAAGTPFARASVRALVVLAVIIVIGFEGATVLRAVGEMAVPNVLFATPAQPDGFYNPPVTLTALFTFWPIYTAAALLALAAVFRAGARFQADTSGLV